MNFEPQSKKAVRSTKRSASPRYEGHNTGRDSECQPNTARIRELKERFDKFKQSREIIDTDRASNKQVINYDSKDAAPKISPPRNKSFENPDRRRSINYDRNIIREERTTPRAAVVDDFNNEDSDQEPNLGESQMINTAEKSDKIQHLEKYLKNVKSKIQNERAKKVEYINQFKQQLKERGDSCDSNQLNQRLQQTPSYQDQAHMRKFQEELGEQERQEPEGKQIHSILGADGTGTYDRLRNHLSMIDKKINAQVQKRDTDAKGARFNSVQERERYTYGKGEITKEYQQIFKPLHNKDNLPARGKQFISPNLDSSLPRHPLDNYRSRESRSNLAGGEPHSGMPSQYEARRVQPYVVPREQQEYYNSAGNLSILESRHQRQFGSKGQSNPSLQAKHESMANKSEYNDPYQQQTPVEKMKNEKQNELEKDLDAKIEEFRKQEEERQQQEKDMRKEVEHLRENIGNHLEQEAGGTKEVNLRGIISANSQKDLHGGAADREQLSKVNDFKPLGNQAPDGQDMPTRYLEPAYSDQKRRQPMSSTMFKSRFAQGVSDHTAFAPNSSYGLANQPQDLLHQSSINRDLNVTTSTRDGRDPMLSTLNNRDARDPVATPMEKKYDPEHDRINRDLDQRLGLGDKISRNADAWNISKNQSLQVSGRATMDLRGESAYGIHQPTPSQFQKDTRARAASQYDYPSSVAPSNYSRTAAPSFEVSRFSEKMEKFKQDNNKMIAEELENKGALLLQKREEYRQRVDLQIDGQLADSKPDDLRVVVASSEYKPLVDTKSILSSNDPVSDIKHSIQYPGYEKQPPWIKNVVTEHCQFKAQLKKLEKEVADKDAILNVTKETREFANNSKEAIDKLAATNNQLQTRNDELVELEQKLQDQVSAYTKELGDSKDLFTVMSETINQDLQKLNTLVESHDDDVLAFQDENFNVHPTLDERMKSFTSHVYKQLSTTFINQLSSKQQLEAVVREKEELQQELNQEKQKSIEKYKEHKQQIIEMNEEVINLQNINQELMKLQNSIQENYDLKFKEMEHPKVNSEKLLKVLQLIDTFQSQHDLSNSIISQINKETKDRTEEVEQKNEEIDRLKAVIIMQETSNQQMQVKNFQSIQRSVENWITQDCAQGLNDKRERVASIEILQSKPPAMTTITEVQTDQEMEDFYNQTMKFSMQETQLTQTCPEMEMKFVEEQRAKLDKSQCMSAISDTQSVTATIPHPTTRDLLNKQIDQIAELKYKIAELQESQIDKDELKKMQDKIKRGRKYEQYYEKQKGKKYRNCGCQTEVVKSSEQNVLRDINSSQMSKSNSPTKSFDKIDKENPKNARITLKDNRSYKSRERLQKDILNCGDSDSINKTLSHLMSNLSPAQNPYNENQKRLNTTEPDEVEIDDTSFHKEMSCYGGGSSVAGSSVNKSFNNKQNKKEKAADANNSVLSKGSTINEQDLLVAMMNIEDDISVQLNSKSNQKLIPKIMESQMKKEPIIPNSAMPKMREKHHLSNSAMNNSVMEQKLNQTPKEALSLFNKKNGLGIPDLIKNAIAQTIKATESPLPNHMVENCDAKTEGEGDEDGDGDESSYYDKSSDISDLEILKNSEALLSKYGALYQEQPWTKQ